MYKSLRDHNVLYKAQLAEKRTMIQDSIDMEDNRPNPNLKGILAEQSAMVKRYLANKGK